MSGREFDQGGAGARAIDDGRAALLQLSFQRLIPISELVAELFYGRLFLLDPSLRPMFRGDMKSQGKKLLAVLHVVVQNVDRFEALVPVVQGLGRRHATYGVRDEHYDTVKNALVWTLQQALGDDLTPATAAAWADMYELVANVMRAAAHEPAPTSQHAPPRSQRAPASQHAPPRSQRAPLSQSPPAA